MNGELSFLTPWDNIAYIAGIYGSCFGQIPEIEFSIGLNQQHTLIMLKTEPVEKHKLIFHSTYPFTAQKNLLTNQLVSTSAETHLIHVDEMKQVTIKN